MNKFTDKFCKIVDFYLFKSPVEIKKGNIYKKVAQMGTTLKKRGIINSYKHTLLSRMKKEVTSKKYYFVTGDEKINDKIEELLEKQNDKYSEIVVFKKSGSLSQTDSLLYMIRNAFAHSDFKITDTFKGDKVIPIYELNASKDDKINAYIRLKETTLLKWIDLIENFDFEKSHKKKKK